MQRLQKRNHPLYYSHHCIKLHFSEIDRLHNYVQKILTKAYIQFKIMLVKIREKLLINRADKFSDMSRNAPN